MKLNLNQLIHRTVEIDYQHQHRHAAGSLSALQVMWEIFQDFDPEQDTFILSKGHAAPALYAVCEQMGYLPNTRHPHPYRDSLNGIFCTTGSLGHGFPMAVGAALANKLRADVAVHAPMVHVLLGDGECLEGTTWEAAHLAAQLRLQGWLKVWIDGNGWQGSCKTLCPQTTGVVEIFPTEYRITKRGFGVPYLEAHPDWHTHLLTAEEWQIIQSQLATPQA